MVSHKQREDVEKRLAICCVTNAQQPTYLGTRVLNIHTAIQLAFVLGARFGAFDPYSAGDFMAAWLKEHGLVDEVGETAKRHQRAMRNITMPLRFTEDEWERITIGDMESNEDD